MSLLDSGAARAAAEATLATINGSRPKATSRHAHNIRAAFAAGYRATADGQIVSPRGRVRLPYASPNKPYARLSVNVDGRSTHIYAHKLAAYQKFGEAALLPGVHVRHLDGNSLNNAPDNLALGSARDNAMDRDAGERRAHALKAATSRRRLTPEQAREVVRLSRGGMTGKAIAERFGLYKSTVSEILSGKLYSEVTGLVFKRRDRKAAGEGAAS